MDNGLEVAMRKELYFSLFPDAAIYIFCYTQCDSCLRFMRYDSDGLIVSLLGEHINAQ